ncbi:SDR family oxidoreductase [Marinobacter nanhaiticus D15-8W]|uniref:NAD-dependent epimerase/dehydratase family protein n=1 Tax=Marinobacter nanhaiticus D15-8W TaxID=626887 RepID=N6X4D7_9GAMM|nr:SDR family oxidoreductase [Marinobacter nanhaiticus]ENO15948.1 NAD-dependent epimerase/dehydratase family protein [Marinobacter nanhaiticus D15-8W]BES73194.1 SDR family oxidoreductase [Marinobacter nanhaiticus D15-8W]
MVKHMLVAGASGVTGRGTTEAMEAAGWDVTTLSRSDQGPGKGRHISGDLLDKSSLKRHGSSLGKISHVCYAALKPNDDAALEADENAAMFENLVNTLIDVGAPLERVIFLQGAKVYGAHLGVYKTPAREDDSRHFPPNLYFRHEDFAKTLPEKGIRWTALRPDIVLGHSLGSAMNLGNLIGLYGSLCREMGVAFQFPGPAEAYEVLVNACDAEVVGDAVRWAAEDGKDGAYNITNGDQFRWKHLWPRLAEWFGLDAGEPQPINLQTRLNQHAKTVWRNLAEREKLAVADIDQIAQGGFGDFIFNVERDAVLDLTKARQAGFQAMCRRTEESLIQHLNSMVERGLIPRP